MTDQSVGTEASSSKDFDDLRAQVSELRSMIASLPSAAGTAGRNDPPVPPTGLDRFLSSGVFFIILGLALLLTAYVGLSIGVHTSFSFVLVVLGVAILLFGTGTQGIGKLESDNATAKYNVALAGGAGVLALCIGFGMVQFGPQMQRAFDVETRYVIATLRPNSDGTSSFENYWATFEIDGVPIASARRGNVIIAFIPYFDTKLDATRRVTFVLRSENPQILSSSLKSTVPGQFEIRLRDVDRNNSGSDFPTFDVPTLVDVRSGDALSAAQQSAAARQLPTDPGRSAPNSVPPADLVLQ